MRMREGGKVEEQRIQRDSFAWNTVSGLLMAFQSVIMLMVIMRVCDVVAAGIFTIAYANANLFLSIGKYGMRQFQVSDRVPQFSFRDYGISRVVTTGLMLVVGCVYLAIAGILFEYSTDKVAVVFIMYLFKAVDALEDVLHGNYQQYGRLDVGARVLTFRLASTLVVFSIAILASQDLAIGMLVAVLYTTAFFIAETVYVKKGFDMPCSQGGFTWSAVWRLLKTCFPLFVAAFLLFYIGNAPKYAIDALLDDTAQAYFGFIAMPVFVVSLLASFVYNPLIASLADRWHRGEVRRFLFDFGKIGLVIFLIAAICVLLAWSLGVPVLNWLYNTDVTHYRNELTVLVAGGAFLAVTSLATLGIAIIRMQKVLLVGYAVVSIAALIASNHAVGMWGITGASWVYFFSMLMLAVVLGACFVANAVLKGRQR